MSPSDVLVFDSHAMHRLTDDLRARHRATIVHHDSRAGTIDPSGSKLHEWIPTAPRWCGGSRHHAIRMVTAALGASNSIELTPTERRLWLLHHLAEPAPVHHVATAFRFTHRFDEARLAGAANTIAMARPGLRTCYPVQNGAPVRRVRPDPLWRLTVVATSDDLDATLDAHANAPMDLGDGPLARLVLIRHSEGDVVLLVTHRLACDQASQPGLWRELLARYESGIAPATTDGREPDAPFESDDGARTADLDYWRGQLLGLAPLDLPTDRPRPAVQRFFGENVSLALGDAVTTKINELALSRGTSRDVVVLAAFAATLFRYTGQTDLAVGTTLEKRSDERVRPSADPAIVRLAPSADRTFRDLVEHTHQTIESSLGHRSVSLATIVKELLPDAETGHHPFFQVSFRCETTEPPVFGDVFARLSRWASTRVTTTWR